MSLHHYYPQLRWKPAEYESLMQLDQTIISGFTPILTILDIDWDYENDCYKKSLSSYLSDFGANLAASRTPIRPVLLDLKYLDKHGSSRNHPLDMCINDAGRTERKLCQLFLLHPLQTTYMLFSETYLMVLLFHLAPKHGTCLHTC